MPSEQKPLRSGFGATATAQEVIAGLDLSGKAAIVTGGDSGIGLETTRALAQAGATVVIPARTPQKARPALAGIPNGQLSALALDFIDLMDALRIEKAIFGGFDWGARTANIIAALWPERCKAMVSVSGYLIGSQNSGKLPLPPKAELQWWYQYYFATERGRSGYEKYRREFAKLIWQIASPKWNFDDEAFDRSAASFDNADHVGIVIHNYRWRLGLADGERQYDEYERRLAEGPVITVPTITLEGDANGAPHPDATSCAGKFFGRYTHRTITRGIGHNLSQEAPLAFADAVIEVGSHGSALSGLDQSSLGKPPDQRPTHLQLQLP